MDASTKQYAADPWAPYRLRPEQLTSLINRWLVRYNPLFLFSALCMLLGVLLVSESLDQGSRQHEIWLTATIELYQVVLILGAALLYRVTRQVRSAVMLGLLAVLFAADVTLQAESLVALGLGGLLASAVWLALFVLKLRALAWAFRLRLSLPARVLPMLGAAGVALAPQLLFNSVLSKDLAALLMVWFAGAIVGAGVWLKPAVTSATPLTERGQRVLALALRFTWGLWSLALAYHAVCCGVANELSLSVLQVAPLLLLAALLSRREGFIWGGCAIALLLSLQAPYAFSSMAVVAALVLGWKAHFRSLGRLWVGALFCGYLAALTLSWVMEPFPAPMLWLDLAALAGCCALAWYRRLPSAGLAAAAMGVKLLTQHEGPSQLTSLHWGVLLLGAGFGALLLGLLFNWRQRAAPQPVEPPGDLSRGPYR